MAVPRIAITAGEPAGIGPELVVTLAQRDWQAELVAIADPDLIAAAAATLRLPLKLRAFDPATRTPHRAGMLLVSPVSLAAPNVFGRLNTANAGYVLATLREAALGAGDGSFDAVVTAPVHKGVVNDAGTPFSGHTEFFAELAGADVVMLLAADTLRVALATTHLPLSRVPAAITAPMLERTLRILQRDLVTKFGIARPRITVLGLNPHAGEGGHLGREEIDVIVPVLDRLRAEGLLLRGPLPADTGFLPRELAQCDAVLAMYHDQGLPVLKHAGFGNAVNVTLGLPIIRTSVDHCTAFDIAGQDRADASSMVEAVRLAARLARAQTGAGATSS